MPWTPPGASGRSPRRRHLVRWIVVGAVVVVVGLVATAVWLDFVANPRSPTCPSQLTGTYRNATVLYVAAACQSTASLAANSYKVYALTPYSDHMVLLGGYVASAPVGAYLVNSSEISVIESNPHPTAPPAQYFWEISDALNYTLTLGIPAAPSQFYLVFENLNAQSLSLRWAEPLQVVVQSGR
ncbi:MAG: hypothetical protein ABSA63_00815 [Thermoplasmata archaeon]